MKVFSFYVLVCFVFSSCAEENTRLKQALLLAGDNREELEKVLVHYSCDSLKLKAAIFLIENMPGHYTLEGELINEYRKKIRENTTTSYFTKRVLDISLSCNNSIREVSYRREDVQTIKADFLIRHIDRSFEYLEKYSWLLDISFDVFLEYVLPYRLENEELDLWIDSLHIDPEKLQQIAFANDIKFAAWNIENGLALLEKGVPFPNSLIHEMFGWNIYSDCMHMALRDYFGGRASAFPITMDCIPLYANRNGCHYWNTVMSEDAKITDIRGALERKAAKVYRRTYSRQREMIPYEDEYVPDFFMDPFYKDVSNEYMYTANVRIPLKMRFEKNSRYAYLCVSNNLKWCPVAIGELRQDESVFLDMGKNLVYLPIYYKKLGMTFFHYPFILDVEGKVRFLKPDTTSLQSICLTRKNPFNKVLYMYNKNLEGVHVEASNYPNFQEMDTVCFHLNSSKTFAQGTIDSRKSYRYWRVCIPLGSTCAEIVFTDSHGKTVRGDVDSIYTKGFDGDPLTNINIYNLYIKKLIVDFRKPIKLSEITCLPRSDGNGIYPGDEYELFYHDLEEWKSLGRKIAIDYCLNFDNVPLGALCWLHNREKGIEERIFTVTDDDDVRFW